jgi:hypothetical protein
MPQSESSRHDEQLDENPYAPPMADIKPAADEAGTDQAGNQRTKHLRRESCIRVTGLFGLILAGLVVLSFRLGSLSELYRQDEEGIPSWMFRRWVARMICLISIVGFSQKGDHFFGEPDPPPEDTLSSPQTPYTGGLRAFEATRVCHMGVTGGPHLTEKVVPSEPVADTQLWSHTRGSSQ